MAATVPLALSLALGVALAPVPEPAQPAPACPGPSMSEVEGRLGDASGAERFAFAGLMTPAFLQLWLQGERPALPVPPDSITVLAEPEAPLVILYGRRGCALGVLRATRPELYQALRSSIGPAV
ncbi:MAG TPA: hypothetical protein PKA13_12715 [Geminicoccaceae bacterium]|nr:hypothetical protein [Geminicoccus sp.]HMU50629.1 hypothetical protein [Geminicoccaceae bacterium]